MAIETDALLETVLATDHGDELEIDPEGSPPGATIRVLYTAPFLGQEEGTGMFANTKPEVHARAVDIAGVVAEVTILRVGGVDYVANRIERVEGSPKWRLLMLNEAP